MNVALRRPAGAALRSVLFDLDGTLADTAPDLCYALNRMRVARNLPELPVEATRAYTSLGARGLLGIGLDVTPAHPGYDAMREEFLAIYENNLCRETRLFPGMLELIGDDLDVIGSGPTAPDSSTFADGLAVLEKFELTEKSSAEFRQRLKWNCLPMF